MMWRTANPECCMSRAFSAMLSCHPSVRSRKMATLLSRVRGCAKSVSLYLGDNHISRSVAKCPCAGNQQKLTNLPHHFPCVNVVRDGRQTWMAREYNLSATDASL